MSHPSLHSLSESRLLLRDRPVLSGVAPGSWSANEDKTGAGSLLRLTPAERACYVEETLGRLIGLSRFTSLQRFVPFWLKPVIGVREEDVKPETLWLLAQLDDGAHLLLAPLLGSSIRYSLRGSAAGLVVVAETGDPAVVVTEDAALFVALGDDPYELIERSARAVAAHHSARLRREKPTPDTVDLFGWCTWDAFYKEVSPEKVIAGLDAFARAGVSPRMLILDDGWQSAQPAPSGEERLVSLRPNARFGGDLSPLVREAKARFGVSRFLVWHAYAGYWGGVCPYSLTGYDSIPVARSFGPGVLRQEPDWNVRPWGAQIVVPSAAGIARFYDDYHASLAAQGVDGVKVDVQAMLEAVAAGRGGRVALHRAYRAALDASVARRFQGRLINCMGATTECAYLADSAIFRSSDDFFSREARNPRRAPLRERPGFALVRRIHAARLGYVSIGPPARRLPRRGPRHQRRPGLCFR